MKPLFIKKNGTVSKVSGIIMNLIPSYTLAEYNALTHKPLLWVRTDEEYAQIPSADVSYGNGSVKDALDNVKDEISTLQKGFKSQTMNVTTGAQGDAGLGLYTSNIQIVTVYANTWANIGLYIYNGEWGIRADKVNTTLTITITYYDV